MKRSFLVRLILIMLLPLLVNWNNRRAEEIVIVKKWNMPQQLKEISGIAYLGNNRLACIMDEKGIVFIYNSLSEKVEREINFWGSGDFEGIAVAGRTIYTVRSNGILYSIDDYTNAKPVVKEYKTWLTVQQNIEGLCYDAAHKRLLLAVKDDEPGKKNYKGIYAFDIATKKLLKTPAYKIDLTDSIFANNDINDRHIMRPSDIAIQPQTKDLYILDGEKPKLLIMSARGKLKKLYQLNKDDFALPEGITFTPKGELFISNEAGLLGKGNILQVKIEKLPAVQ